jgi:hypothetical protein
VRDITRLMTKLLDEAVDVIRGVAGPGRGWQRRWDQELSGAISLSMPSNDAPQWRLTNILCTGTERGYDVKSAMDVLDGVTSLLFGSEPSGGK